MRPRPVRAGQAESFPRTLPTPRKPLFKNLIVYRIGPDWSATVEHMEEALAPARFVECGATQQKSIGWIEPRGEKHGAGNVCD